MMRKRMRVWAAAVAMAALTMTGAAPAALAATEPDVAVVVQAANAQRAATAVLANGGVVDRELQLIGAVAARVTPEAANALAGLPGINVTADEEVRLTSTDLLPATTQEVQLQALNPGPEWSPDAGSGVGVALIDTGVADTPDLAGRVVHGPDYSDEGDGVDHYGHGTFMAGLIAGDGSASAEGARHYGVAPGAHIVSLKLAGRDGVTSMSKVLDAIGWVVTNQDAYGIRVMNLSIGVPTKVAPQADPLSAAVQAAWASGVTVVAASGNEGTGVVTSPGRDPWVITVGSTDANGTAVISDDTVPSWSGSGRVTSYAKPDVLAPGASVVSLRAPGSLVDESFPEARVGEAYFRGSGTSMSAAIVSGAVAALAEHRPLATPDDFKGALVSTGDPVTGTSAVAVDLAGADAAQADTAWRQDHPTAFTRGDGQQVKEMPWARATSPSPEDTWSRMKWADGEWTRMKWADGGWTRMKWADGEWVRMKWADGTWTRMNWADTGFARMKWADADFARMKWAEVNFARMKWADANFTRMKWAGDGWARMKWAGSHWTGTNDTWVRLKWADAIWES